MLDISGIFRSNGETGSLAFSPLLSRGTEGSKAERDPDQHREVITSRPLLLQAIARKTQHAGRTTLSVSSTHGEQQAARRAYLRIARFFARLREKAEQLDAVQRWYRILSEALRKYLRGRQLIPPARLQPS